MLQIPEALALVELHVFMQGRCPPAYYQNREWATALEIQTTLPVASNVPTFDQKPVQSCS
jgi:hypothetical protein